MDHSSQQGASEFRVLLKTATGKDAALARAVLEEAGVTALECASVEMLAQEIANGAGALLVAEEFLPTASFAEIVRLLAEQPSWSDLPVLILARTGADSTAISSAMAMPVNFAIIERPVRVSSFVSAVKVALRARARQYELRDVLEGLQLADQRKTEFLATLAHELRNPLAPLSNALTVLQMKAAPNDDAATYYAMMERQLRHMTRLVDDLMEVSRITRGKIELKWEEVPLDEIVRDAIDLSRPRMEAKGHEFALHHEEKNLVVLGDALRLAQVLSNVLNNAAKYTPQSGKIDMTIARKGAGVEIRVKDNGAGIPADMLDSIFEMFVQVTDVSRVGQGGLGIGLTLVKNLVELHGGQVAALSEGPGKGTEIVLTLPLLQNGSKRPSEPASFEPIRIGNRILIVDDNHEAADSLRELLAAMGAATYVAYNGPDALQAIGEHKPTHAILDIGMPGMNGWELASRIRADLGNSHMILIALTGWGQAADKARTKQSGFNHHLLKPVDNAALVSILQHA